MSAPIVLHATLLARRVDGLWQGLLLTGPSGSGKSDLALRMAAAGWRLVSDDRTVVWQDDGFLYGRAPAVLTGLIELRGQGIFPIPVHPGPVRLRLWVDCVPAPQALDRMPEVEATEVLGVALPRRAVVAIEASAVARLDLVFARP